MNNYTRYKKDVDYNLAFESEKWREEIPSLNFKPEWNVKILPPFNYAVIRFSIEFEDKFVSVYLDCYDLLGCMGAPYWEVYSRRTRDCQRFYMNNHVEMMNFISEEMSYE